MATTTRRCLQWNTEKAITTSPHKLLPRLPAELIESEILTRLPVKSLLRFRSVCKAWKWLISCDPDFIKTHLLLNPNNYDSLILKNFYSPRNTSIPSNCVLQEYTMLIGCINGLVCFYNWFDEFVEIDVAIWNPATKQCKVITPLPMTSYERDYDLDCFGFGFDSVTDDYKVVYISTIQGQPLVGVVYSCKDGGCWRKIAPSSFLHLGGLLNQSQPTIFNGSPYWLSKQSDHDVNTWRLTVISFDIRREVLRLLPFSIDLQKPQRDAVLVNLRDSLAVMVYDSQPFLGRGIDVYILNERCDGVRSKSSIRPFICQEPAVYVGQRLLQCFGNGDILFKSDDQKLYCFDPQTHIVKSLDKQGHAFYCWGCTESLVFIDGMEPMNVNEDAVGIFCLNKY